MKLEVTEHFSGAKSPEFTVHLTSDAFLGRIPQGVPAFSDGESWLVEAYYDAHLQQWMTSSCQRTKLVWQATEDLEALRAWIAGDRLPGRVQGQVANPGAGKYMSDVRVALRGPSQTFSTMTDNRGQFTFDGLEAGIYEATTDGAREISVNLTYAWCSYVVFLMK
ncbi:MAG: carboxypeptidase regulatory-like domain-containing protein [Bryobacteraceae bacterium]|nr:carboxypeptidase regulatory-like domain-containing protein [Bryobacteraceae bacterium]